MLRLGTLTRKENKNDVKFVVESFDIAKKEWKNDIAKKEWKTVLNGKLRRTLK